MIFDQNTAPCSLILLCMRPLSPNKCDWMSAAQMCETEQQEGCTGLWSVVLMAKAEWERSAAADDLFMWGKNKWTNKIFQKPFVLGINVMGKGD